LEVLFAPWRMAYIEASVKEGSPGGCIFCDIPARPPEEDAKFLVLHRGRRAFVMMNAFPYNPGHLMVAPYRHVCELSQLDEEEMLELMRLQARALEVLKRAMSPHGFNLGVNLGRVAGAGIPGHMHVHVVPRWEGDTNFMPVVADVKVIPEALGRTYEKLKEAWGDA